MNKKTFMDLVQKVWDANIDPELPEEYNNDMAPSDLMAELQTLMVLQAQETCNYDDLEDMKNTDDFKWVF